MRPRCASSGLLAIAGIRPDPHPAIARFARVNGIPIHEVEAMVDEQFDACAVRGVHANVEAIIEALGIALAFQLAAAEIRNEKGAA